MSQAHREGPQREGPGLGPGPGPGLGPGRVSVDPKNLCAPSQMLPSTGAIGGAQSAGGRRRAFSSAPPQFFLSVDVCKAVMRMAKLDLNRYGIDPDDPSIGIPLRGMAYRAMNDVQADQQYAGMSVDEKAGLASKIVAGFYREVAATATASSAATFSAASATSAATATPQPQQQQQQPLARPADIGSTPVSLLLPRERFDAFCDPPQRDVGIGDPHAEYARAVACENSRRLALYNAGFLNDADADDKAKAGGGGLDVIPRVEKKRLVARYLFLNGYDRDYVVHPNRYSWSANIAAADSPFMGVRSIAATCLIVPREVYDEHNGNNNSGGAAFTFVPKTNYRYAHGLPFPYLILNIADFQSVYKSTNAASAKAFAHFVFHSYYSSPNGRDYIRMEPVQSERLTFDINPLAQLSQLTVSVQQPSGALLNGSKDDLKVRRIRYADATATFARDKRRLLVELSHHFDRNEFFKNDTVRFAGFGIPRPEASEVNAFVTRPEGHRIVDMLVGNHADDMVDGFYVQIMGDHNLVTGDFDIDQNAVQVLAAFNDALDEHDRGVARVPYFDYVSDEVDGAGMPVYKNHIAEKRIVPGDLGRVINASLQCTVSFRLQVEEDDVSASGMPPMPGEGSFE